MKWLDGLLGKLNGKKRPRVQTPYMSTGDMEWFPAFPKGIENRPVNELVDGFADFIENIKVARGLIGDHNKAEAELLVYGPIRNYAEIVHYLPATEDDYYYGEGGLFRFGIECAFHAYRASCAKIMNESAVETRLESEIRWNHAAFLSGLYSEAIHTLSRINVYSQDGKPWHQGHEIFTDWMRQNKVESYQISWRQEPNEELATTVAARIIGQGIFGFLATGEKNVITTFCDSLMNANNMQNPLTGIVRGVRHKLMNKDIDQNASKYGSRRYGMHLEPWLIDAFRYLYNTRKWTVNEGRSALWYGKDGVYITWPGSFNKMAEAFKETNVPFVPHGPDGLMGLLHDSNIIVSDKHGLVHEITLKDSDGKERKQTAIKLSSPDILFFGKEHPKQLDYVLSGNKRAANSPEQRNQPNGEEFESEQDGAAIIHGNQTVLNKTKATVKTPNKPSNIMSVSGEEFDGSTHSVSDPFTQGTAQPKKPVIAGNIFAGGTDLSALSQFETNRPKTPPMTPENIVKGSPELSGLGVKKLEKFATLMAALGNGDAVGDDLYAPQEEEEDPDEALKESLPAIQSFLEGLDGHGHTDAHGQTDGSGLVLASVRDSGVDGGVDAPATTQPVLNSVGQSGNKAATVDLQKLFQGGK